MLRPVDAWLRGERDAEHTKGAFRVLVNLPSDFFRRRGCSR
jgi:hypothetical protein